MRRSQQIPRKALRQRCWRESIPSIYSVTVSTSAGNPISDDRAKRWKDIHFVEASMSRGQAVITPQVRFTPANWFTAQTVEVKAVDDQGHRRR